MYLSYRPDSQTEEIAFISALLTKPDSMLSGSRQANIAARLTKINFNLTQRSGLDILAGQILLMVTMNGFLLTVFMPDS